MNLNRLNDTIQLHLIVKLQKKRKSSQREFHCFYFEFLFLIKEILLRLVIEKF